MDIDLTTTVRFVLWLICGALVISLGLALALNKTAKARTLWPIGVLLVFALGLRHGYQTIVTVPREAAELERQLAGRPSEQDYKELYAKAKALFDERCKTAGEKIYRTIDDVDGVLLANVRAGDHADQRANPNWPDAALPDEAGGADYVRNFLYWEHNSNGNSRGYLNYSPERATARGYRYVDVRESGGVFRYRLTAPNRHDLLRASVVGEPARYVIEFKNYVDPEDRKYWIAGTKITVIDTLNGALLAERVSYSFEPGLGSTKGFRAPWGFAVTCPKLQGWVGGPTRFFVDQFLKPPKGE